MNLDERVDRRILLAACQPFGEVKQVEMPRKGQATIEYFESGDADDCVDNLDSSELYGRVIRVTKVKGR